MQVALLPKSPPIKRVKSELEEFYATIFATNGRGYLPSHWDYITRSRARHGAVSWRSGAAGIHWSTIESFDLLLYWRRRAGDFRGLANHLAGQTEIIL